MFLFCVFFCFFFVDSLALMFLFCLGIFVDSLALKMSIRWTILSCATVLYQVLNTVIKLLSVIFYGCLIILR